MAQGIFTLIVMLAFAGIVYWAYSTRRRQDFEEAANLPLLDDQASLKTTPTHKRAAE